MSALPATFAQPWSFRLRIPVWRMELRHQGRDAIPNAPCRLLHFRSNIEDCCDENMRLDWGRYKIGHLRGFVGDSTWSQYERASSGDARDAKGRPALGFVAYSGTNELRWNISASQGGEFEQFAQTVEKSVLPGVVLSVFLYGHESIAAEGDRGEVLCKSPIMMCSFSVDHGEFPDG